MRRFSFFKGIRPADHLPMLRKFCSSIPHIDDTMGEQTELSTISDEEFLRAYKPLRFTWYQRLFQIVCFFVFLGPLRVLFGVGVVLSVLLIALIRGIGEALHWHPDTGRELCFKIYSIGGRLLSFACGHIWVSVYGKVDPKARVLCGNHNSFVDAFIVDHICRVRSSGKDDYRKIAPLRLFFEIGDIIWIDRSKNTGVAQLFAESINDFSKRPLMVFPEGTMTNGECLLKFRTGGFLTKHPIQPFTIRYWQSLVPKGWNTNAYTEPNFFLYAFGLLSMPPSIATIELLPLIYPGEDETPDQVATRAQLAVANALKVKATNRSSSEIFARKRPAREKEKEQ
jgi:1-acyl-sn-glycerol-3-phosphate acyltransferase